MIASSRLGDSHVCPMPGHGTTPIVTASSNVIINGMGAARVGDVCVCGAVITTGFPSVLVNGLPLAHLGSLSSHGGTLVSGSGDTFGGSLFAPADGSVDELRMATLLADPALTEKAQAANALVSPLAASKAALQEGVEPGFHIVEQPMSRSALIELRSRAPGQRGGCF